MSQQTQAAVFHKLHHTEQVLVLPNAWDVGSARLIENAGAQAIATTSAGLAWAHGYSDGHGLPVPLLAATVAAIVRAVNVPVSTDIEGGYSDDLDEVEQAVLRVIDAGAVGINLEDGAGSVDLLCAKIESARRAADRAGVSIYVNARTDVYLQALVPADLQVEETLRRANRYRGAGADGLFVPALTQPNQIREITSNANLPVNVLAWAGLPNLEQLQQLGVKRLSAGSGIARAMFEQSAALARTFLKNGKLVAEQAQPLTYAQINELMKGQSR